MSSTTLRSAVAWVATKTGSYDVGQWVCGRLGGGFILAYHDLPPAGFEEQVDALGPNEPIHLSELFDRSQAGRSTAGLFALTVDDGVAETVRSVSEVCLRRRWPVTFYLPTAYVDGGRGLPFQLWFKVAARLPKTVLCLRSRTLNLSTPRAYCRFVKQMETSVATQPQDCHSPLIEELAQWLINNGLASEDQLKPPEPISWNEVTELSKGETIRFESHGVTHTAAIALDPAALKAELDTSKRRISEHTNRDCRHFCYPFGGKENIGSLAPSIVAEVYDTAVTMSRGRVDRHPRSLLPRIPIYERDDQNVARLKILTV